MKKVIAIIDVPEYLDIKQCKVKCEILNIASTRNYIGYLDLKPLPQKLKSASEYGSDDEYIKRLIIWKKEIDEILGEKE